MGLWRGIYAVRGREVATNTRLMGATLLTARPTISHRAAAYLWRLMDGPPPPVEVTSPGSVHVTGLIAHKKILENGDVTQLYGIKVTSPHRTLIDLGDVVQDEVVEDALDRALERRITSAEWLQQELSRLGTRGKKGAAALRSILEDGLDEKPPSWLERRFIRLLRVSSLPSYSREFPVDRFRIDFAWPEVRLAVEVHGSRWHRKRRRWASDLARHNCLTAMGWTILHLTWDQIRSDPQQVVSEIVETYRRLGGWMSFSR